ncbi:MULTISPECIES: hypothetical protein [Sorangium]|uniref:hypothetical protein n=1 Tax=Sorangium TaxID=39643 RepID=UPI003D9C10F0
MTTQEAFLKFLDKVDDRAFTKEFNKNPQMVMSECELTPEQAAAINEAGRHKGEGEAAQRDAITNTFKSLGLDPADHHDLINKLVDNYEAAW